MSRVYLWSEHTGVQNPPLVSPNLSNYVTSVSFSSPKGCNSILAVGRQGGRVSLWSTFDHDARFEITHTHAIACVSFKHVPTRTISQRFIGRSVDAEELLVGDEIGEVYYYSIEWTDRESYDTYGWRGAVTLLARISVHAQQICGLAWSPDGAYFASGSNDNQCCLFEVREVLRDPSPLHNSATGSRTTDDIDLEDYHVPRQSNTFLFSTIFGRHRLSRRSLSESLTSSINSTSYLEPLNSTRRIVIPSTSINTSTASSPITTTKSKHRWHHRAAVKAIAFCPWQRGLLATGGGSNDRCIHFYHTFSGAKLATINVAAQVTSLIWSATRREIAATFGYAQPEHPYRIAVFAWPSCEQVVAIPWGSSVGNGGDMRALYAIAYPGGPNESRYGEGSPGMKEREGEGSGWWGRTRQEGCIVVASSDESVKFHEVWSGRGGRFGVGLGMRGGLGGSDILEGLEGADGDGGEVIR
jgi:WD40 repeat protein